MASIYQQDSKPFTIYHFDREQQETVEEFMMSFKDEQAAQKWCEQCSAYGDLYTLERIK